MQQPQTAPSREQLQVALTQATAQRAASEQVVNALRTNLTAWRDEENAKNPVKQALLFGHNSEWFARIERFMTALEQHTTTLRNHEAGLTKQLSELPAEPPSAPAAAPKKSPRGRR